jgi:hypothetical protein
MDVATLLFLALAALLYVRWMQSGRWQDALGFMIAAVATIASKAQHAVLGFWLAALVMAAGYPVWRQRRKWVTASAGMLALLSAFWMARSAPPEYARLGVFTVVFGRILPHAENLDATLRALTLDDSHRRYIGMNAYSPGSPLWDATLSAGVEDRLTYRRLAWFYLTHPRDAYRQLCYSLGEAGIQRPYLGNFDVRSGHRPFDSSTAFAFWSGFKKRALHLRGSLYLVTFVGLAAALSALLMARRRTLPPPAIAGTTALIGMAATALLVASLADAIDIPRHHMLFYFLSDMLVVVLVHLVARDLAASRTARPD